MAERRMFAKTIIDSDAFLDMSLSTQALYFHLSMRADDEGFLNNPKKIMRMIGASEDDLKVLLAKRFILSFDTGVIVIKHWRIHNYIQKDRLKETVYQEERAQLEVKENGAYTLDISCIQNGYNLETQGRLGKDRLGEDRLGKDSVERFHKPTLEEVEAYCLERQNGLDAQRFVDYYEANGWRVGRNPMKDWKAAVRTWEGKEKKPKAQSFEEMMREL